MPAPMKGCQAATLTIRPSPFIRRSAARQQRNVERRLSAIIFSKASSEVSATVPPTQPPAQWTAP